MKGFSIPALLILLAILGAALLGVEYAAPFGPHQGGVACTTEAKLCPDGSAVGRTGPNCEFAACPEATSTGTTGGAPVAGPGEHCGGNMLNAPVCSTGYHCQLKINMPDTGGTCVADSGGGGGIMPYNSGVQGTVLLGPTCPVMRNPPDPQCADRPYQTTVYVYRGTSGTPFATTQSAADGSFKLSLPPGQYALTAQGGQMLPRCNQTPVTVGATGYTVANISCDTGIR